MTNELKTYIDDLKNVVQEFGLYDMVANRLDALWDCLDGVSVPREKKDRILRYMAEILLMIGGRKG